MNDAQIIALQQQAKKGSEDETRLRRLGSSEIYLEMTKDNCTSVVSGSNERYEVTIIEGLPSGSIRESIEDICSLREAMDLALDFDPRDVRMIREEREARRAA